MAGGVATAAPAAAAPGERPLVYAFIVANNQSLDASRAPLHFADDDAARYDEMFASQSGKVELFTVLDADTQRIFPELVARAQPPRRAVIEAALTRTFADIQRQVDAGHEVAFYFILSGHGDVDDGQGYVHLLDGRWTRSDLFQKVIAPSTATVNHIIIDACNAYFLVADRGGQAHAAGDYSSLIRDFVGREKLERYPNTGVLLSTSRAAEVHEWGRIEAGIFSHELRSAFTGAADATGDGAVDYHEAAAYIDAANGALPDQKTRLHIYARPPARNIDEPLFWSAGHTAHITVPASWTGRFYLEDDRGVRYADFNKSAEVPLHLELVPRDHYYLRSRDHEMRIDGAEAGAEVTVASLEQRPLLIAARGATSDLFDRYLFAIPYGPGFLRGYR